MLLLEEKSQVIRKSGLLEYYSTDSRLDEVGGLTHPKKWLARRGSAVTQAARAFGLPEPKGVLLLGVQGCGKSLTARAIATNWRMPLVRLDMGRIYSGYIGSSEENLRRAIRVVSALYDAFADGIELEPRHLLAAIHETKPLAVTMAEDVMRLREWAKQRTRPAS